MSGSMALSGSCPQVPRRTVLVTAAWSLPVLSVSVPLPAAAAASGGERGLTVTVEQRAILRGCMLRVTALASDAAGAPVAGTSVTFSTDVGASVIGSTTLTTDSAGRASALIDVGVTTASGQHTITAIGNNRTSSIDYIVVAAPASAPFDWRSRAIAYDEFAFDWTQPGEYPTITWDRTHLNVDVDTWKMPSYYGQPLPGDGGQEAITQLPAIVGATLVGIDKSSQDGRDYVDMARTFFHPRLGVALNNPGAGDGGADSFWYAATANVMLCAIAMLYPDADHYGDIFRSIADKYQDMVLALGGSAADFTGQGFDFTAMRLSRGSRNEGGDAAAATAVILLWAHSRFGDARYLDGARWALGFLDRSSVSVNYEWATLLAPFAASRVNAEASSTFDVRKLLMFTLQESKARPGWGTLSGSWAGYNIDGLQGSLTDGGGYAFAMGTFATAFLAPTVKYDVRYAGLIGSLLANVANAARFFYPDQVSTSKQIYGTRFVSSPAEVVAYEGFRAQEAGVRPRATGDPSSYGAQWGLPAQTTDLGLYGSGWVGIFASTVEVVSVGLVRIDVDRLDLGTADGLVRSLWVNTGTAAIDVTIPIAGTRALYDVQTDRVLVDEATDRATIGLPPGSSRLIIEVPPYPQLERSAGVSRIGGVVVNFRSAVLDLAADRSVAASSTGAGSSALNVVDGDPTSFWSSIGSSDEWISIDLSWIRFVSAIEIVWVEGASSLRVDVSVDGSVWSSVSTVGSAQSDQMITFPAVFARFVRLSAMSASGGGNVKISDVRVTSRDLASRALAVASSSVNANVPAFVTDGDVTTRWESATSDPQWIFVDLGSSQSVGRLLLWWETASAKEYRVEVSDDAAAWSTVYSTTSGQGGRESVTFPSTSARFVRIFCIRRNTQWAYSIIGLGVFGG